MFVNRLFIMTKANSSILIIGEFPVFHKGYTDFLAEMARFDSSESRRAKDKSHTFFIGILGNKTIKELTALEPDIRKVSEKDMERIIDSYLKPEKYFVIEENNFSKIFKETKPDKIIILKGDKSEDFADKFLGEYKNVLEYFDVRLRWQDSKVREFKSARGRSAADEKESLEYKRFMDEALKEAEKSKCWWRQVGAVAVKDGKIIFRGFNKMLPNDDECYKIGCIRDSIAPGKQPEICSVTHAEATIISLAAKEGVSLDGTTLYVTHFPCPACAKLVALAGFKKLVYSRGSSVFDGERVMASRGVDIIKI